MLRKQYLTARKEEREIIKEQIEEKRREYAARRDEEIVVVYNKILHREFEYSLKPVSVKGKEAYTTNNMETLLVSKFLMLELKRSYKVRPANRNDIVEELYALLDGPMPKLVVRADISHFFESIPQDGLVSKLTGDAFISHNSVKSLRSLLYQYNDLVGNRQQHIGIPRGLCFSSYLSEIYMRDFDADIRNLEGVYFYKRYVDDIVIIANPSLISAKDCWKNLQEALNRKGLRLTENKSKLLAKVFSPRSHAPQILNYLGYQFRYYNGHADILLTADKVSRYKDSIRLIFEKYKEIGNYCARRSGNRNNTPKTDATLQFMHRLNAITANGCLDGRKNYVRVGIYYSNKFLTSISQLQDLDDYIKSCLDDPVFFNPPQNVFQYGYADSHERCIAAMKEKILSEYSFKRGFVERRMYRWKDYKQILKQIQNIYYLTIGDE